MKSVIKLVEVWKIYKIGKIEVPAVCGINLEIKEKEFISIMGPSGSGKSTTMNIIGCLDVPTRGRVYVEGKDVSKLPESELATIRNATIGFIFQQFNLIPNMNALENVTLPMVFRGIEGEKRKKIAIELLSKVGLSRRIYHKPFELSGGEQQRVAIARALANNPKIILADEPTGNLDSKTGKDVIRLLIKLNKEENKTIVVITHDENIAKYAKRIVYIKDGKIIKEKK